MERGVEALRLRGVGRKTERERENSECFIVEGHLTHYKWYDYKHVHTTYIKQLSNNTKQTDKTKRNRKKETNTKQRERERERGREGERQRQLS